MQHSKSSTENGNLNMQEAHRCFLTSFGDQDNAGFA